MRGQAMAALLVAGLAAPVVAQEAGGRISGTLGGAPAEWEIRSDQTDFSGDADFATVSIVARGVSGLADGSTLLVGFELVAGDASAVELFFVDRRGENYYGPPEDGEDDALRVSRTEFGPLLGLRAEVASQVMPSPDLGRTLDPEGALPLDVQIEARIAPLD